MLPLSYEKAFEIFNLFDDLRTTCERYYNIRLSDQIKCSIKVENGKDYRFNNVPVSFEHCKNHTFSRAKCDWYRISIFWEDAGVTDYQQMGLFGYYDTDYSEVQIEADELIIKSSNQNIIIIKLPRNIVNILADL